MAVGKYWLFLVVLNFVWTFTRADTDVSCVFTKSCILPCSFLPGNEVVIHWIQLQGDRPVHSYYHDQDQLAYQHQSFRSRTSLFQDQIPRGNASLLLSQVQLQHQGRYKCYTSTITGNKEIFVNLKVEAPVTKVHLEQEENRLSCSSEGIYPEPELTWSTEPPSSRTFNTTTTVQQTEQLLYNISSSLTRSPEDPDVVYICTVSCGTNRRRTTLLKPTSLEVSSTTTIHCSASEAPITSITWRFNYSQVIVDHSSVSQEWQPFVEEASDTGSLTLQHLSSSQDGVYTCELNNAEGQIIESTHLKVRQDGSHKGHIGLVLGITAVIVIGVIVIIVIIVICLMRKKNKKKKTKKEDKDASTPMNEEKEENVDTNGDWK